MTSVYHSKGEASTVHARLELDQQDKHPESALQWFELIPYRKLERIFLDYNPKLRVKSEGYRLRLAEAFNSPLYSDNCKRYFAATHLIDEVIFSVADQFLTAEIILGYLEKSETKWIDGTYVDGIMRSSHLNEKILEVVVKKTLYIGTVRTLQLTPDALITPRLINLWRANAGEWEREDYVLRETLESRALTAERVRQAHPEYEGFPDEWVLTVFCGR